MATHCRYFRSPFNHLWWVNTIFLIVYFLMWSLAAIRNKFRVYQMVLRDVMRENLEPASSTPQNFRSISHMYMGMRYAYTGKTLGYILNQKLFVSIRFINQKGKKPLLHFFFVRSDCFLFKYVADRRDLRLAFGRSLGIHIIQRLYYYM